MIVISAPITGRLFIIGLPEKVEGLFDFLHSALVRLY